MNDNENALLYDINSIDSVLHCLERILEDKQLRNKLQKKALNTIQEKKLTWENNAKRIECLFESLCTRTMQIKLK